MDVAEFLRLYNVRAPNIMWFLGAGASAAAGVPTAYDMIWDFKRTLYCTAQRVSVRTCDDLASPVLRNRLQQYFDAMDGFPPENASDEYAHYFEATYPSEEDRRLYIERLMASCEPSFGHLVLGALFRLGKARASWTTNFDRLPEDASATMLGGSGRLTVSTLDTSSVALRTLNEARTPLLVKLHGDFQSSRLKNTTGELQSQDAELRRALVEGCKRSGLAVVGYSGRDQSIMDALEEAIDGGRGYPFGLFWFSRSDSPLLPATSQLLQRATAAGIGVSTLSIETFDELMGDLLILEKDLPQEVSDGLNRRAPRLADAPVPPSGGGYPAIRVNVLPIISAPTFCRRVACQIGGQRAVRDAIQDAGVDICAARRNIGVIAFGGDADVRKTFDPFTISGFDLHSIEPHRLAYDSAEHGLLYEALSRALSRERPLNVQRHRRTNFLVVDPAQEHDALLAPLRQATAGLAGTVPGGSEHWWEAVGIRLEFRLRQLWLVVEPTVLVERSPDPTAEERAREFVRERLAVRYNASWNALVSAWAGIITAGGAESELRTFGTGDGVDAVFSIGRTTPFSGRATS